MKKLASIIFLLLLLSSCRQNIGMRSDVSKSHSLLDSLPQTISIISKTISFDSAHSKGLVKCEDIPSELNTLNGCIIRKGSKKYIRQYTVLFDENYQINKLYFYLPMGPDYYTKNELLNDTSLLNWYGLSLKNNVRLDRDHSFIIDNADTLPIVDYWQKEKLIFVDARKFAPKGLTLIYGHG